MGVERAAVAADEADCDAETVDWWPLVKSSASRPSFSLNPWFQDWGRDLEGGYSLFVFCGDGGWQLAIHAMVGRVISLDGFCWAAMLL